VPPRRSSRFGSPLVLSSVHWVRPELVVEVKYLTWTCGEGTASGGEPGRVTRVMVAGRANLP
jgi:hypothetical protein